jgi:hypothetical protein
MVLRLLCYGLAMSASFTMAAQVIPSSRILRSVQTDNMVQYYDQHVNLVKNTNQQLPFAEELSLRTETDRFDPARQEYLARLTVNGLREIRETNELNRVQMQSIEQGQQILLHDGLVQRYEAIAGYYFAMKAVALHTDLEAVYTDRFLVLKKIAAAHPGEVADDLIRTEYNRDDVHLEMLNDSANVLAWRHQVETLVPDLESPWLLDTSDFISIHGIKKVIAEMPSSVLQNPRVSEQQNDIALILQEYDLVKARSNKMLDFVQLRYSNNPSQPVRNDFGIGLGLSLPFRGSAKPKMAALVLEKNEADMQLQLFTDQAANEIAVAKNKILAMITQFDHAVQQWEQSQAKYTLSQSASSQPDGPITMLRARELQLERLLHLLDMEKEIVENYLLVLDITGYVSKSPRQNYLSENLESW